MKKKSPSHKLTMRQIVFMMIALSAVLYDLHYQIFQDFHHIAIFFLHDIAFLPLEVLLVSLGLDRLIERSKEEEGRSKLSIIESMFFKESGGEILRYLCQFDPNSQQLRDMLQVSEEWTQSDFINVQWQLRSYDFQIDVDQVDFFGLHDHLSKRHEYYLHILENPTLTQSNEFTELVMTIYLLWEELDGRTDLYNLDESERHTLGELLTEIYREGTSFWLDNAYNHSVHNPLRIRLLVAHNPFSD